MNLVPTGVTIRTKLNVQLIEVYNQSKSNTGRLQKKFILFGS